MSPFPAPKTHTNPYKHLTFVFEKKSIFFMGLEMKRLSSPDSILAEIFFLCHPQSKVIVEAFARNLLEGGRFVVIKKALVRIVWC